MAGRGPAPKPASQRRRRNAPTFREIVLPAEGRKGRAPSLPKDRGTAPDGKPIRWTRRARDLWAAWWRSPMATQWTPTDVSELADLLSLHEDLWEGSTKIANEVRLRADSFGLTPKGRQERRWTIAEPGVDETPTRRRSAKVRGIETAPSRREFPEGYDPNE